MRTKEWLKRVVRPLRIVAGRFVIIRQLDPSPIQLAADLVSAENVPGDYLEFGVFRGLSFLGAYDAITASVTAWNQPGRTEMAYSNKERAEQAYRAAPRAEMRLFAFDSFDGLPEPSVSDTPHPRFPKGSFDCSEEDFRNNLLDHGVDLSQVVVVP